MYSRYFKSRLDLYGTRLPTRQESAIVGLYDCVRMWINFRLRVGSFANTSDMQIPFNLQSSAAFSTYTHVYLYQRCASLSDSMLAPDSALAPVNMLISSASLPACCQRLSQPKLLMGKGLLECRRYQYYQRNAYGYSSCISLWWIATCYWLS